MYFKLKALKIISDSHRSYCFIGVIKVLNLKVQKSEFGGTCSASCDMLRFNILSFATTSSWLCRNCKTLRPEPFSK